MFESLRALADWLRTHEFMAIWLEGLALVAIFFLDWWTRREEHKESLAQMEAMQSQLKIAEDNAQAARDSATHAQTSIEMQIAKERARIRVVAVDLKLETGPLALHGVEYTVFCYGTTPAFIEESWANAEVTDSEQPPDTEPHLPMSLGKVLLPTHEGIKKSSFLFFKPEGQLIGPINDRKLFVHFYGSVSYQDVFAQPHETKFRYLWRITDLKNLDGTYFASWQKHGGAAENSET